MSIYSESYDKHKNLALAAKELNIPLPTLYWNLKKDGVNVVGDKLNYGSLSDKFGAKAENLFQTLVPSAINQNEIKFQSKVDFICNGLSVDIKGANLKQSSKKCSKKRWAFSFTKQESIADYFVCIGFKDNEPIKYFLIVGDLVRFYQSISISETGKSKWNSFEVSKEYITEFFEKIIKT